MHHRQRHRSTVVPGRHGDGSVQHARYARRIPCAARSRCGLIIERSMRCAGPVTETVATARPDPLIGVAKHFMPAANSPSSIAIPAAATGRVQVESHSTGRSSSACGSPSHRDHSFDELGRTGGQDRLPSGASGSSIGMLDRPHRRCLGADVDTHESRQRGREPVVQPQATSRRRPHIVVGDVPPPPGCRLHRTVASNAAPCVTSPAARRRTWATGGRCRCSSARPTGSVRRPDA